MPRNFREALQVERELVLDQAVRNVARQHGPYIMPQSNHWATLWTLCSSVLRVREGAAALIRAEFARLWAER